MANVLAKNLLLGLPRELRNQILKYASPLETTKLLSMRDVDRIHIHSKQDIQYQYECGCDTQWDFGPCPFSILWVNRQLRDEAFDLLYSKPVHLYFHEAVFFGGYAYEMAKAAENGGSYVFPTFSKHF